MFGENMGSKRNNLTQKQEHFCRNLFEGMTQHDAYIKASYSSNMLSATIDQNACRLATNSNVVARIAELQAKAENESIMSVIERKARLTEIARARLTDFMELGQDGSWVNVGKETPQGAALQEIHSRTEYDKDGAQPTVYTSVKLHDPMKAIDLLNKMEGVYSDNATVNIDNRIQEIKVVNLAVLSNQELNALESILIKAAPDTAGSEGRESTP